MWWYFFVTPVLGARRYTGAKPGESTVVLMYARPWEKESDPAAKVNLTVKVN